MSFFRNAEWVIVDADDTLWHDGRYYARVERCFIDLCGAAAVEAIARIDATAPPGESAYASAVLAAAASLGVEDRLLRDTCETFLAHELELLPRVEETLAALAPLRIALVTKGPVAEQQSKIARSGLSRYFSETLFLPRKDAAAWRDVFTRLAAEPRHTIAIGNNLADDILPPHANGARTIWLNHPENPYRTAGSAPAETWVCEGWTAIWKEARKG